jgi:hypothetical protein
MAGGVGQFFANLLLDKLLGAQNFTPPATWYAALMTAAPSDTGGGTEVSGGSYARVAVTNNTTNFPSASSASLSTGATIDWGTATANWGTITHVAFYDASSGGNLGPWGPLSVATLINSGSSFKITAGNGVFTQA